MAKKATKKEELMKLADAGGTDSDLMLLDKINEVEENVEELKDAVEDMNPDLESVLERLNVLDGEDGDTGPEGPQGLSGRAGEDGKDGKQGIEGKTGIQGPEGKSGRDGREGVDGKDADVDLNSLAISSVNLIETFEGDDRIDVLSLKNLDELPLSKRASIEFKRQFPTFPNPEAGGSGATFLESMRDIDRKSIKGATNDQVLTFNSTKGKWDAQSIAGGGHTIQEEGSSLTQRSKLNFVGTGLTATDGGAGPDSTIVTLGDVETLSTSFTQGSVVFAGGSGTLAQDNSVFFWDATNNRLALGLSSPLRPLHVNASLAGSAPIVRLRNTSSFGLSGIEFFDSSNADKGFVGFGNASSDYAGDVVLGTKSTDDVSIFTNNTLRASFGGSTGTLTLNTTSNTGVAMVRTSAGQWNSYNDGTDTFGFYNRAGTPEGNIAANIGSIASDTSGGDLYVKTTDTANTGWASLLASGGGLGGGGTDKQVTYWTSATTLSSDSGLLWDYDTQIMTVDDIDINSPATGSIVIGDANANIAGNNTVLGFGSGGSLATGGTDNVILGQGSGTTISTADQIVIIGVGAGNAMSTLGGQVLIGFRAGADNTQIDAVFIGKNAGRTSTGAGNIYIGAGTAESSVGGSSNTYIGDNIAPSNTSALNVMVGYRVMGASAGITTDSVLIGANAASVLAGGVQNTYIGSGSAKANVSGSSNTFLGYNTGLVSNGTNEAVLIGSQAGESLTTADRMVFMGFQAGEDATAADDSVAIGYRAGRADQGGANVFLGSGTGIANTTGTGNNYIGKDAGNANVTGTNSIVIGASSAPSITTLTTSILLGCDSDGLATTTSSIGIGYGVQLTGNNQLVFGSDNAAITNVYIGKGVVSATPTAVSITNTTGVGTNIAGGNFIHQAGAGTGTGTPGIWVVQTARVTSSGTTPQTYVTAMGVDAEQRLNTFSGRIYDRTPIEATNYSILKTDHIIPYISIDTGGSGNTTTLPSLASADEGQMYIIKDESGTAGTHNITIATAGSETIDGSSTQTISANYGVLRVYWSGGNYFSW